jgi:hypothetical protein
MMRILLLLLILLPVTANANDWRDINTSVQKSGMDTPIHMAWGAVGYLVLDFYLNECGLSSLDGNKDGVPCESLCW